MFLAAILACWLATFAGGFAARTRGPLPREVRRGRGWAAGFWLQIASIALVWAVPRQGAPDANPVLGIAAVLVAAASAWIMLAAQRELGRQFALQARLVEGHQLITSGPYRLVRNPIYLGLYGLALAVALVWSRWTVIPLFTAVYAAGTAIRVVIEQRLLRDQFGAEFDEYARRVPAVVPGLRF